MLKIYRTLTRICFIIGEYFEDRADSIDTKLHDDLRQALKEPMIRTLRS